MMADDIEAQKARFYAAISEKEAIEAEILTLQAPLVEDKHHPDRENIVALINVEKDKVMPLAKEITNLAKMLNGKL